MIVVPEIQALERTGRGVRLQLKVPADLSYFQGHFPNCPLLPGVVQISWAIELGRAHLPFAGRFRALSAVKFMRVILPGSTVTLTLDWAETGGRSCAPAPAPLGLLSSALTFAYELDGRECSNGTALFDA